ncbi:U-box domain-containing protein 20-like [Henckelia pumila]|uniref:U-box domain-containing protein 20-like n=1 Tax=Henckelia pumila TaxID=405737 RepID=UPI003C6E3EC7
MISSWKRLKAALRAAKKREDIAAMELTTPTHFICPISLDLMKDPVTLSTGITYDRRSIESWIEAGNATCPITNKVLRDVEPIPNHAIRKIIQDWCVENSSFGVERIPTPRIPISSHEVFEILAEVEDAIKRDDIRYSLELVSRIKALAKESERNKRCIVSNGAGRVLSFSFQSLSTSNSVDKQVSLLEEILSTLTMMMTMLSCMDEEMMRNLSKNHSLHTIVWFLRFGSLTGQRNAALVLKTILSWNQEKVEDLVKIQGFLDAVVKLIKNPICPTTTKASLMAIHHILVSSTSLTNKNETLITRLLEMGLVQSVLVNIVDSDRSTCEKGLGVLDGICSHLEGRKKVVENALFIPLVVKKLLRISGLATEFSVSILWKLLAKCDENGDGGRLILEALQVGAFHKLLLVLQVGCNGSTKEKVTEILKTLNVYRNRGECVDSSDFKNLKRPF